MNDGSNLVEARGISKKFGDFQACPMSASR